MESYADAWSARLDAQDRWAQRFPCSAPDDAEIHLSPEEKAFLRYDLYQGE